MAIYDFKLPDIGEGVVEGEIVEWQVELGQIIAEDDMLASILTDKATVEIPSPVAGKVAKLAGNIGDIIDVGSLLISIDTQSEPEAPVVESGPVVSSSTAQAPPPSTASQLFQFKLPDIGEGVVEGEIVEWYVQSGANIAEDEMMLSVLTDKATVEIPSPVSGTIQNLIGNPGDIMAVGDVIIEIMTSESGAIISTSTPSTPCPIADQQHVVPVVTETTTDPSSILAMPSVRVEARKQGIDLNKVNATGHRGQIILNDLENYKEQPLAASSPAKPTSSISTPLIPTSPIVPVEAEYSSSPFVGLRRKIAGKMSESYLNAVHVTIIDELNVSRLVELRARLKDRYKEKGYRLTFMPFVIKAACIAIKEFPVMNSQLDMDAGELRQFNNIHMGMAAATDRGLIVPVIKHADQKSLLNLCTDVYDLAIRTRDNTAKPEELSGSTFTISNVGAIGGTAATPIINYPEVAILGMGRLQEKPVVDNGQIVIGHLMNLFLTFDHRVVDGGLAAQFLNRIMDLLVDPDHLFMEM